MVSILINVLSLCSLFFLRVSRQDLRLISAIFQELHFSDHSRVGPILQEIVWAISIVMENRFYFRRMLGKFVNIKGWNSDSKSLEYRNRQTPYITFEIHVVISVFALFFHFLFFLLFNIIFPLIFNYCPSFP